MTLFMKWTNQRNEIENLCQKPQHIYISNMCVRIDTSNGKSKQIILSDCNDTNQFFPDQMELIEHHEQIMQYCEPLLQPYQTK